MAKAGRPRKPTKLRIIEGNPGHRPIPEDEPQPSPDMPIMPDFLDPLAVDEWNRVAPEMWAIGVITSVDGSTLEAYCVAYAAWRNAEIRLRASARNDDRVSAGGILYKTKSGNTILNPLQGAANVLRRDMVKLAAELGLTPSSRASLEGARKRDEDPTDKKYFKQG